jgi:hypothetical protein
MWLGAGYAGYAGYTVILAEAAIGRSDRTSQLSSIEDNPRLAPKQKFNLVNLVESRISAVAVQRPF